MGRKNFIIEDLAIIDIGAEGKAIAKHNDKVVFLPMLVPGDVVDANVVKNKSSFMEAIPVAFKQYSKDRVPSFCEYFGSCGGCKWQHLDYSKQLYYKEKQVFDQLERIGKLTIKKRLPILASEKTQYYRNKLEFTFSNRRWLSTEELSMIEDVSMAGPALGFHVAGLFDKVLDIHQCYLQSELSNDIRNFLRDYALKNEISFFDIRNHVGILRNLVIRTSSIGEIMVIVSFYTTELDVINPIMQALSVNFPSVTSWMYAMNMKGNDSLSGVDIHLFSGRDFIYEELDHLKFRIAPQSFFQTNSNQTLVMYRKVLEFAKLSGNEVVYDLYTGTGTIANFLAPHAAKVVGIEYVPEAIEDAEKNSEINNLSNTVFYAGDMKDVLNADFIITNGTPDVLVTDPPRAGMHADVVKAILEAKPKRIVYVSCNPATQARDIALLAHEYSVEIVQPLDMFPHTHHVENIVLLERMV